MPSALEPTMGFTARATTEWRVVAEATWCAPECRARAVLTERVCHLVRRLCPHFPIDARRGWLKTSQLARSLFACRCSAPFHREHRSCFVRLVTRCTGRPVLLLLRQCLSIFVQVGFRARPLPRVVSVVVHLPVCRVLRVAPGVVVRLLPCGRASVLAAFPFRCQRAPVGSRRPC